MPVSGERGSAHAQSRWPYPSVIAHRGGGKFAPENTLSAIRQGHAMGFRGVEFDVMLSQDSMPLLIHDETLERTTNGHGRVADTTMRSLGQLDAGAWFGAEFAHEPLPSFESATRLCLALGLWANIEIKPAGGHAVATGRITAALAQRLWRGATLAPLLSSFQPAALAAARESAPKLPRGLLFDAVPSDWRTQLQALECVSLHCNADTISADTVREVHAAGYAIAVWTVNDAAAAQRLFAWGVDAIFTDRLDIIRPDFAAAPI